MACQEVSSYEARNWELQVKRSRIDMSRVVSQEIGSCESRSRVGSQTVASKEASNC